MIRTTETVRVLIIEDSTIVADLLRGILETDPRMEVVGHARNGRTGVELCKALRPDVVTMDIRMPVMDGLEATETIMAECPTPILVLSSTVDDEDLNICFHAIQAGAMEVMEKPQGTFSKEYVALARELVDRIRLISKIRPIRRYASFQKKIRSARRAAVLQPQHGHVLAIAASTGGPAAVSQVLGGLPAGFPWPILLVQHIASGFQEGFSHWLATQVDLNVKIGAPGERPSPGTVYLPSEGCHLGVDAGGRLILDPSALVDGHRPSATYLFRSVAKAYGAHAMGVVLTGMGRDGAAGLREMHDAGAYTVAQDEETSLIYGMPKAAVEEGGVDVELPLQRIASRILIHSRPRGERELESDRTRASR